MGWPSTHIVNYHCLFLRASFSSDSVTGTNFVVLSYMRNFSRSRAISEIQEAKSKWCHVKLHGSGLSVLLTLVTLVIKLIVEQNVGVLRESSFNTTRGGDEDIEGGSENFRHPKGGSEKIRGGSGNLYTSKPT